MKTILLLSILLMGCASVDRGGLTLSLPMEVQAKCDRGRVIYPGISVHTNWEKQTQEVFYSWQCYVDENDNERTYIKLGENWGD